MRIDNIKFIVAVYDETLKFSYFVKTNSSITCCAISHKAFLYSWDSWPCKWNWSEKKEKKIKKPNNKHNCCTELGANKILFSWFSFIVLYYMYVIFSIYLYHVVEYLHTTDLQNAIFTFKRSSAVCIVYVVDVGANSFSFRRFYFLKNQCYLYCYFVKEVRTTCAVLR